MIGVSVGQYECRSVLGEGGSGVVYLAVHRVLGKPLAVKVLRAEWTRYPELVTRFINEARAAASIRHRNIIGVHDCGELPGGERYILLDYLEGSTLARYIASHGGPLAPHDAVHVLAEVANGLQAAHDSGIFHRDLKPDNIHIGRRDGDPRAATILDFGVAKLSEAAGFTTEAGALIGTPAYMAPEQLSGEPVGAAADVFALGVISYQMMSGGRLPWQRDGESDLAYRRLPQVELYHRIVSGAPVDLRRHHPGLSPAWLRAIHAALDPDATRRPPSPRALALLLAEATPGDDLAPSGLALVRSYAAELLEVGTSEVTVRTALPRRKRRSSTGAGKSAAPRRDPRYLLRRRIGEGGMAEVFEGQYLGAEGFARKVAIKKVRRELALDARLAELFIAEARLASQLSHPNVVAVLDFDRDQERRPFLVMEHVDGEDLSSLLRRGELPVAAAIFIASEVLRGLGYAHQLPQRDGRRGLLHRDLSPHNVLLSREGAVKISDFGLARALEVGDGAAAVVRSSALSGKPAYMSPEQGHGRPLDARSDLFAVGIILWEMLTGQRLFTGSTRELMAKVQFKAIAAPGQLRPGVPADLDAVVMRLLERDRERRYPSAYEAAEALLACADAPRDGRGVLVALLAAAEDERARERAWPASSAARAAAPGASGGAAELAGAAMPGSAATLGMGAPGALASERAAADAQARQMAWAAGTDGVEPSGLLPLVAPRPAAAMLAPPPRERRRWPWRWRSLLGMMALVGLGGAAMATSRLQDAAALPAALSSAAARRRGDGEAAAPVGRARPPRGRLWPAPSPRAATGPLAMAAAPASASALPSADIAATASALPTAPAAPSSSTLPGSPASSATPTAAAGDARHGTLVIAVRPWARVWVDGRRHGETPLHLRLPAGRHRVRLANHRGLRDLVVSITAARSTLIEQEL